MNLKTVFIANGFLVCIIETFVISEQLCIILHNMKMPLLYFKI